MKKKCLAVAVVLLFLGLSGCTENKDSENNTSIEILKDEYFTLSGTIDSYYNGHIDLDLDIVGGDFELENHTTKHLDYSTSKQYSFNVKSGYSEYSFRIHWSGNILDDISFTNPSGTDLIYNINIDNQGVISIS
jgi:hypothetical protein